MFPTVDYPADAWAFFYEEANHGDMATPRGLPIREVSPAGVTINYPTCFVTASGRQFYHKVSAVEGLSLIGQIAAPEIVVDVVPNMARYMDQGIFWGSYGQRTYGDLGMVYDLLRQDPDSRQAVVSIYDSGRDLLRSVRDVPCTLTLQFLLREGRLNLIVSMRSNDVWYGTPYDFGQFMLLQHAMATALKVKVGTYTHVVGSLHVYEPNWDRDIGMPMNSYWFIDSFRGNDWEEVSSRARSILLGRTIEDATNLERSLRSLIGS